MSTRSLLVRVRDDKVEYGQVCRHGETLGDVLNSSWQDPSALFERLVYGGEGICTLGNTLETTEWLSSSYNCACRPLEGLLTTEGVKSWLSHYLDEPEFVFVFSKGRWHCVPLPCFPQVSDEEAEEVAKALREGC